MGAAASVRMVYREALNWLRVYMDSETYNADFAAIDKDRDGGITFGELQKWVQEKAKKEGGSWSCFKDHPQIMQIAHKSAGMGIDSRSSTHAGKVVDIAEFRLLLMHLFAVSILLVHFEHADDLGSKQLGFDEFKTAVFTFCHTHAHERLSDEQIQDDFDMLDSNKSDSISFQEVCNYCCKFIDPKFHADEEKDANSTHVTGKGSKLLGIDGPSVLINDNAELGSAGPKSYYSGNSTKTKNDSAFDMIAETMARQIEEADKAMEALVEEEEEAAMMQETPTSESPGAVVASSDDAMGATTTAEAHATTTEGGVADTLTTDTIESVVTEA